MIASHSFNLYFTELAINSALTDLNRCFLIVVTMTSIYEAKINFLFTRVNISNTYSSI